MMGQLIFLKTNKELNAIISPLKNSKMMRKTALFSSLIVALATFHAASAQDIYVRFDDACVEKLEYRFVEQSNGIAYSAYKLNKNANENVYFETGVEVPQIRKTAPSKMVSCSAINLSREDVADINSGRRKAFIVKKLDSGWAYLAVGSAAHMSFSGNVLKYLDATSDFQTNVGGAASTDDLSLDKSEENAKASVYYAGEMTACNFTAYLFKKSPRQTCKEDATIAILPGLGLIQDFATGGQRFELVGINNTDVCGYYATPTTPAPVMAEPTPEVPQSYSVVAVKKSEFTDGDVSTGDNLSESAVASKSVEEPACLTIAAEGEHIVQRGESLYGIARRYGLTVNSLRDWNGMNEDVIYPCSPLKITGPAPAPVASMEEKRQNNVPQSYDVVVKPKAVPKVETPKVNCNVEAGEGEHVVMQGESLYAIARTYNLKVADLRTWNKLKEDKIMLCQKLFVVAPVEAPAVPKSYVVVVKPKLAGPKVDFKVAAKSVPKAVKVIEKPRPVEPFIANTVTITAKSVPTKQPVSFVKKGSGLHVVKKGETIAGLAKETNMSEGDFRKLNNLSKKETISVGQVLRTENCACNVSVDANNSLVLRPIPVATDIAGDVPKDYNVVVKPKIASNTEGSQLTAKSVDARASRKYHVVQPSETLTSIAKTYKKSVDDIRTLNKLDVHEVLVPNQLLLLE
jgi:LysM repeat protein